MSDEVIHSADPSWFGPKLSSLGIIQDPGAGFVIMIGGEEAPTNVKQFITAPSVGEKPISEHVRTSEGTYADAI